MDELKRLLGSEIGTVRKAAPKLRVALIYPNSYWVGMSNLGLHTIYYELNRRQDTYCERAFFSPFLKVPTSLETQRALSKFDILAFSISFELDYLNVVKILQSAGIPLSSRERAYRFPLIMAGGVFTFFNLRPLANFIDCFVVGEGEEVIHEAMDLISSQFPAPSFQKRQKLLSDLAKVDGLFVPGISKGVKPRRVDVGKYDTTSRILTPNTEFRNMWLIELSRGCNQGCKFCLTGCVYGRMRIRSLDQILASSEVGLKYTKRIGLVAAAVSDYPQIDELCQRLAEKGARISVSSLRPDSLTPTLLENLIKSGQRTFTIAPEAGSERLRFFLNKRITDVQVIHAVSHARDRGMKRAKLYFMIGLPTETDDDISSLIGLIKQASKILPVKCSITPFVPKPKTQFADYEIEDKLVLKAKLQRIRAELSRYSQVSIISESLTHSILQAKLAKGDEDALDFLLTKFT